LDIRLKTLQERLKGAEDLRSAIEIQDKLRQEKEIDLDCLKGELADYRRKVQALQETVSRNQVALKRKEDIQAAIDRLNADKDTEYKAVREEIDALKTKYKELQGEIEKCQATLKEKDAILNAADQEKEITGAIDSRTPCIEFKSGELDAAKERIHALELGTWALDKEIKDLENDQELTQISLTAIDLNAKIRDRENDLKTLDNFKPEIEARQKLNTLKDRMAALDLKDADCQSKTCSFIVRAVEAKEGLLDAEASLDTALLEKASQKIEIIKIRDGLNGELALVAAANVERRGYIDSRKKTLFDSKTEKEKSLKAEKLATFQINEALITTRQQLADLRNRLMKVKELAARVSEIQVAESRSADLNKQLSDVTDEGLKKRNAWEQREIVINKLIDGYCQELTQLESEIDNAAAGAIDGLNAEIESIEQVDLPRIEKGIQEARETIAQLQGELSKMADAEKELAEVQAEKDRITREISEWTYLRNACGKNGLQALEIDGAAPLITGMANDLLGNAFGPLYSVKLITQDAEGKECLDIVTIGEDGSEILLDNLSGGQKIWNLMALRLGMTLLSKEKSGRNFETAFFDELDGPLDPDNAVNFINMYKAFMKVGGFSVIPFISHKPSCRSLADHILSFEPGRNPEWR
jgi:DNA repair exonuclease SbcCD ATPase subunit